MRELEWQRLKVVGRRSAHLHMVETGLEKVGFKFGEQRASI